MSTLELYVNNKIHSGWKSATITKSIDAISGHFQLNVSEYWQNGNVIIQRKIHQGNACQLKYGSTVIIDGYIDESGPSYDSEKHDLQITGRDITADLIDCSAVNKPGHWKSMVLEKLVREIVSPFGFTVELLASGSLPGFKNFALNPGETAFEAIDRACRMCGVLPRLKQGTRIIQLFNAGTTCSSTQLIKGKNIKSAGGNFTTNGRYSTYTVKGQCKGNNDSFGITVSQVSATATDAGILRYRPLIIVAEGQCTPEFAKKRAAWEAIVRAVRSESIKIVTPGWLQDSGELWDIDLLVSVTDDFLDMDATEMLVTDVVLQLDQNSGSTTELTLRRPDAYTPPPLQKVKSKKTKSEWLL
jgi:prophage tail gpP-like protein